MDVRIEDASVVMSSTYQIYKALLEYAVTYLHILGIPHVWVCFGSFMSPSASDAGAAPCPCLCTSVTPYSCVTW